MTTFRIMSKDDNPESLENIENNDPENPESLPLNPLNIKYLRFKDDIDHIIDKYGTTIRNIGSDKVADRIMDLLSDTFPIEKYQILNYLVEKKIDVIDSRGCSPIFLTLNGTWENSNLQFKCVELLLKNNADLSLKTKAGNTPLHVAGIYCQYLEIFSLLLRYGAQLNALNNDGQNPLFLVLKQKFTSNSGKFLFIKAAVEHLHHFHHNPHHDYDEDGGENPTIKMLNNRDKYGRNILHYIHLGQAFRSYNNRYTKDNNDTKELCDFVLSHGADPFVFDEENKSPLFLLLNNCIPGHVNIDHVKSLFCEEHINRKLDGGYTILHAAIRHSLEIIKFFLNNGADPNLAANNGLKPSYYAGDKYPEVLDFLEQYQDLPSY